MDIPSSKLCTICKQEKPLEAFNRHKGRKDGLTEQCRACRSRMRKAHYHLWATSPRETITGSKTCTTCGQDKDMSEFYDTVDGKDGKGASCKECEREDCRKWKSQHKEEIAEYNKDYRSIESEAARVVRLEKYTLLSEEERKALYEKHREYLSSYTRKNRDQLRKKKLVYRQNNPEIMHNVRHRRRARVAQAPVWDLTAAEWQEIQETQKHRCAYCGKLCKGTLTMDHITPLAKGGSHTLHNVIGACLSCNASKSDRDVLKPVQPLLLTTVPQQADDARTVPRRGHQHRQA